MSNDTTTPTSKFSLITAIAALFKMGDLGKLEHFFAKQRKEMGRDIAKLEKDKEVSEFNFKNESEDLGERIEDAALAVENAYLNVDIEKIGNNSSADAYATHYWSEIEEKEAHLDALEDQAVEAKEAHKEAIEEIQDQIDERQRRMDRISKKQK